MARPRRVARQHRDPLTRLRLGAAGLLARLVIAVVLVLLTARV